MGNLSAIHLGAVGIGSMIFNFIYWNFGFLRMGTTGMTAQAIGAKNDQKVTDILFKAIFLALGLAFILLLLQKPIASISLNLMNAEGLLFDYGSTYFKIRILAAPASLLLFVLLGWFFGMQNAMIPLVITVLTNIVNIVFSYYFVVYLNWDVAGVAWGTVLAQYFAVVLALAFMLYKYRSYLKAFLQSKWEGLQSYREFLQVNGNLFIRTVALTLAFGIFYSRSTLLGAELLAVNVVLLQFINWMSYGIDGFAYAAESIVGKYKGAEEDSRVIRAIKLLFVWGLALAIFYTALFALAGQSIFGIFTEDSEVLSLGNEYLFWIVITPICAFAAYIWDGIYIGLTATKKMRDAMLIAFVIFLALLFILESKMANHGIWLAFTLFLLLRGLIQGIYFWKYKLKIN